MSEQELAEQDKPEVTPVLDDSALRLKLADTVNEKHTYIRRAAILQGLAENASEDEHRLVSKSRETLKTHRENFEENYNDLTKAELLKAISDEYGMVATISTQDAIVRKTRQPIMKDRRQYLDAVKDTIKDEEDIVTVLYGDITPAVAVSNHRLNSIQSRKDAIKAAKDAAEAAAAREAVQVAAA